MATEIESPMKMNLVPFDEPSSSFNPINSRPTNKFGTILNNQVKAKKALVGSVLNSFRSSFVTDKNDENIPISEKLGRGARGTTSATTSSASRPYISTNSLYSGNASFLNERQSPRTLQSCMELLESKDIDDNRKGLQLLALLTRFQKMVVASPSPTAGRQSSRAIIFGETTDDDDDDDDEHVEGGTKQLRELLLPFICDNVEMPGDEDDNETKEDASMIPWRVSDALEDFFHGDDYGDDDESIESDESYDERPRGRHWGALHVPALRAIVNALEQTVASGKHHHGGSFSLSRESSTCCIDFSCDFWRNVMSTLIHNIEMAHSADVSGYSLRCLRLLQTIEPGTVTPLLQHSLLPFLIHLKEYGETHSYPMIQYETSNLSNLLKFAT